MASDRPIATVDGTMLVPGVSRNNRLYTKGLIAKAVERMKARIADPNGLPIVMRTHHEANDNSAMIVGRVIGVDIDENGAANYSALLYDTQAGRDIAALVTPKSPALKSVSIHGYWLGPVKTVKHNGESVTTGDDLEIDSVDWTASPGVLDAKVSNAAWITAKPTTESAAARTPISESVEATITTLDDDAGEEAFADPIEGGYDTKARKKMAASGQAMKDGSYPIANKSDLRKAIHAVGRGGADHNAIRKHVMARARALGLSSMIPANWNSDGSLKETVTQFGEIREYMGGYGDAGSNAGFCIDAFNGPTCLTLRVGCIEPDQLRAAANAAMNAACDALRALDPDMDADIDVGDDMDGDESVRVAAGGLVETEGVSAVLHDDERFMTLNQVREALGAPAPPKDDVVISFSTANGVLTEESLRRGVQDTVRHYMQREHGKTYELDPEPTTENAPVENGETTSTTEEVPAVSEATNTEAAETTAAPARTLTDADIAALGAVFSAALKEHAPAAIPAAESTTQAAATAETAMTESSEGTAKETVATDKKALDETVAQIRADLAKQLRDELREELLRTQGKPSRNGYRVHENDHQQPDSAALWEDRTSILLGDFAKTPVPAPGTGTAPATTVTQPEVPQAS